MRPMSQSSDYSPLVQGPGDSTSPTPTDSPAQEHQSSASPLVPQQ
jgi:hypothetical protein